MKLKNAFVGQRVRLVNGEGLGRTRMEGLVGQELTVAAVVSKASGVVDQAGHVQGIGVAEYTGILFKARRFDAVPDAAVAPSAPQDAPTASLDAPVTDTPSAVDSPAQDGAPTLASLTGADRPEPSLGDA